MSLAFRNEGCVKFIGYNPKGYPLEIWIFLDSDQNSPLNESVFQTAKAL